MRIDSLAIDVDHLLSVRQHPELRLTWSNLRSFCHSHHSARTARDQGFARPREWAGGRVV
jgi:5-methylcytosine-specific restriction endonuclease McrA